MKPIKTLSRRSLIRVVSAVTAAFLVTLGFAVSGYVKAHNYKITVENQYNRALDDLGYYCTDIHTALTKGLYAGTNRQFALMAAKLSSDAAQAKTALGSIPQGEIDLSQTYKFLSQVGDYAMALTRKVADGGRISAEEWEDLRALAGYSQKMADEVDYMRALVMDDDYLGGMVHRTVQQAQDEAQQEGQAVPVNADADSSQSSESSQPEIGSFGDSFDALENGFDGYPSLIYDGPFSEHLEQQTPALTQDEESITAADARTIAAKLLDCSPDALGEASTEAGKLPSYCFFGDDVTVTVSAAGGHGVYCTRQRDIGELTLEAEDAVKKAQEYLESIGYTDMMPSYHFTNNGVCTVNLAYEQDGVICYPDLIKVNVALDNGDILGFDARGYIMNHKQRDVGTGTLSQEDCLQSVSPFLEVEKTRTVVIPSSGSRELLCYEYRCIGREDEQILVYVNAENGNEEQLLILLRTDNGTLTL